MPEILALISSEMVGWLPWKDSDALVVWYARYDSAC